MIAFVVVASVIKATYLVLCNVYIFIMQILWRKNEHSDTWKEELWPKIEKERGEKGKKKKEE